MMASRLVASPCASAVQTASFRLIRTAENGAVKGLRFRPLWRCLFKDAYVVEKSAYVAERDSAGEHQTEQTR